MNALRSFLVGTTINARSTDLGLLFLRVFSGLALALAHGRGKFPPSQRFVENTEKMGFPLPEVFAWAAAGAELIGGVLLAIGLLTRPSATLIVATMATAAYLGHAGDPFGAKEKALLFGVVALLFLFSGAGRFSLDAFIGGSKGGAKRARR